MKLSTYLNFNGQCAEAFAFYEQVLKAKIAFKMTYGESPMASQCTPDSLDKIMHVSLQVGDQVLMGSDAPADRFQQPQGFSVSVSPATPEEAERIFAALADGAKAVMMPIQETFWAQRFGMVMDKFGIPWMVNCEKPM